MAKTATAAPDTSDFTPVTFRDKAYKSRVIIVAGKSYAVVKSTIVADGPELMAYLSKHPDFERAE